MPSLFGCASLFGGASLLGCVYEGLSTPADAAGPAADLDRRGPPPDGTPLLALVPADDQLLLCAFRISSPTASSTGSG